MTGRVEEFPKYAYRKCLGSYFCSSYEESSYRRLVSKGSLVSSWLDTCRPLKAVFFYLLLLLFYYFIILLFSYLELKKTKK